MITTSIIPPQIIQSFNSSLLSYPLPGMKEPEFYRRLYGPKAKKKYAACSKKMREFNETLEIYEKLYEWKKAQEAYNKAKDKNTTERPHLPIEELNKLRGELGKKLRSAFFPFKF